MFLTLTGGLKDALSLFAVQCFLVFVCLDIDFGINDEGGKYKFVCGKGREVETLLF